MLLMTPEYAALREEQARETIDWLVGNFNLKPIRKPVMARLTFADPSKINSERRPRKTKKRLGQHGCSG